MLKHFLLLLFFTAVLSEATAQNITGPTPVYVNTTQQYVFNNGVIYTNYLVVLSGGTLGTITQNGTNYYINVNWTTAGSGYVRFKQLDSGATIVGTLNVTIQSCFTPATSTATFTYANNCGNTVISASGTPPANTTWYWQTSSTGTATTTSSASAYTVTGSATYYLRSQSVCGTWGTAQATASVTVNAQPSAPGASNTSQCSSGTMTASPGANGDNVRWYAAATGGSPLATSTTSPLTSATTTYYLTTYNSTTQCESTPRTAITFTVLSTPPVVSSATVCSYGTLQATPGANCNTVRWYNAASGGTLLATNLFSPVATATTTWYAASYHTTTGCESGRTAVTLTVNALPVVTTTGTPVQLTTASAYAYQWKKFGVDIPGATSQGYTPDGPGSYAVAVKASASAPACTSVAVTSGLGAQPAAVNYTATRAIVKEGVTASGLPGLAVTDAVQAVTYADGLGRAFQSVAKGQSGTLTDLVTATAFGKQGVTDTTYLPYATGTATGLLRLNALRTSGNAYSGSEQQQFYQNATTVAHDNYPFARTLHRASPDARTLEQGAPGADWQPSANPLIKPHTVRSALTLNTSSYPVRYWKADGTTSGNYPAGTVSVALTTDENGNAVRTYTNAQGQTVLKQVQLDSTINGSKVNWLETYYLYDVFGRLIYQLPPKAVALLSGASYNVASNSATDELVYKYNYDSLGRVVEKKVPGSGWEYVIYDKLGRVALTQDALQRASKQWLFIKYDFLNRPVYTGVYTETTLSSRKAMQNYYINSLNYPASAWYESEAVNATTQGYTNTVFPTANVQVLTVTYYDHYDFNRNGTPYSYDNSHLAGTPAAASTATRGLPTGSRKLILGTSNWLISAVFYDAYDRPLQTQSNNHLNLAVQDKVTILYKDLVHVDKTKATHTGPATVNVVQRYTYDNAWRTTGIYHTINSGTEQQLAAYVYNALGQVVKKQLHYTPPSGGAGGGFLQNVDYRYHLRGWLSSINNAQLANDGGATNSDTNDYFGLELFYNTTEGSGLGNSATYNGNISAVKWKNGGAVAGASDQRSYKLLYDKSEKLASATFQAYTGSAWTKEANTLNEVMSYDHNGNVATLQRNQNQRTLGGVNNAVTVDQLTYTYTTGNQLSKVTDAAATAGGFTDGANNATEYSYNATGSLTADQNKGISTITYNVLGKPQQITYGNGTTIVYTYDASGTKLKTATTVSGTTTTTDYAGSYVYTNNALSFFSSPEGRVVKNGSNYEYQYAITDHQGNTRVVFTSAAQTTQSVSAGFETANQTTEATNFSNYPTSSHINTIAANAHSGSNSLYLNGGYAGQVGVAKSYKVYAGDQLQIQAYARYNTPSGTGSNLAGFATALLNAFGLSTPVAGETGTPAAGINTFGSMAATGFGDGSTDNADPKVFVNIVIFDKNYNFIDVAYQQLTTNGALLSASYKVKEAGYAFMYVSNEQPYLTDVYFDDITMSYTPSVIVQSNEYYPFGLQTVNSWTRDNTTANNFLANGGTELNTTSSLYDLDYRNYDPILARMHQVDPKADYYSSHSPYHYSFDSPVMFNDPNGADPEVVHRSGNTFTIDWEAAGDFGGTWIADGGNDGNWTPFHSNTEALSWGEAYQQQQAYGGGGQIVPVTVTSKNSYAYGPNKYGQMGMWIVYGKSTTTYQWVSGANSGDGDGLFWSEFNKSDLEEYVKQQCNCTGGDLQNEAGRIFENTFHAFMKATGDITYRSNGDDFRTDVSGRKFVRPDGIASSQVLINGGLTIIPNGSWYEVKATSSTITASSFGNQAGGMVNALAAANPVLAQEGVLYLTFATTHDATLSNRFAMSAKIQTGINVGQYKAMYRMSGGVPQITFYSTAVSSAFTIKYFSPFRTSVPLGGN